MTTENWFEALTAELLAQSPFRRSEYFTRFASGALSREQVWAHISQHYLLIAWFPRIFSGIHTRCDDVEVRKDCAHHLLVEDLGYFEGRVGGTPDHDELYRRIGDDLGYSREAYERIVPGSEMAAIIAFFRLDQDAVTNHDQLLTIACHMPPDGPLNTPRRGAGSSSRPFPTWLCTWISPP